jgi:hypothetical protein
MREVVTTRKMCATRYTTDRQRFNSKKGDGWHGNTNGALFLCCQQCNKNKFITILTPFFFHLHFSPQ